MGSKEPHLRGIGPSPHPGRTLSSEKSAAHFLGFQNGMTYSHDPHRIVVPPTRLGRA